MFTKEVRCASTSIAHFFHVSICTVVTIDNYVMHNVQYFRSIWLEQDNIVQYDLIYFYLKSE